MISVMSNNSVNDEILKKIIYLMLADDSADAPADSVKWAKNLFRSRAAAAVEPKKSLVSRVLAVLQIDLSGAQPAFGERSATASQVHQMFFQAGENGVDLRISKTETGLNVQGQVLGEGFANYVAKLGEFEAIASELSEFRFTEIPDGKYDLIIEAKGKEIVIEGLELN